MSPPLTSLVLRPSCRVSLALLLQRPLSLSSVATLALPLFRSSPRPSKEARLLRASSTRSSSTVSSLVVMKSSRPRTVLVLPPSAWLTVRSSSRILLKYLDLAQAHESIPLLSSAAAVFTNSLLRALKGEKNVVECSYVESPLYKDQGATCKCLLFLRVWQPSLIAVLMNSTFVWHS